MTPACARAIRHVARNELKLVGIHQPVEQPARMHTESLTIIERIARGDQAAVAECYDAFAHVAWSTIRGLGLDEQASREVMQDVFVAVWRQAGQYDAHRSSEATWICRIARARAIDCLRRQRAARRGGGVDAVDIDGALNVASDDDTERSVARDALRSALRDALFDLPAQQRVLIELVFLSGYTHAELAERLDIPIGTIKTRIFRGLNQLRTRLDPSIQLEDLA